MPYITDAEKSELAGGRRPRTVGELNYCVTRLMIEYCHDKLSYKDVNDAIGAVECAKLEFYRRMAVPYEDIKISENGDVYTQKIEGKKRQKEKGTKKRVFTFGKWMSIFIFSAYETSK